MTDPMKTALLEAITELSEALKRDTGNGEGVLLLHPLQFQALQRECGGMETIVAPPSYMGIPEPPGSLPMHEIKVACPSGWVLVRRWYDEERE